MGNKELAVAAMNYAKEYILKGSTQLENNIVSNEQRLALLKGVSDIRAAINNLDPEFYLETEMVFIKFYRTLDFCKRYSLGNCYELAIMALDYSVNTSADVNTEVFHIEGGDHVFLVIGRNMNSDYKNPLTWGDDTYICDPWSNKTYPAKEYLKELKNYKFKGNSFTGYFVNTVEDFNPKRHQLQPEFGLNSDYIKNHNTEEHINQLHGKLKQKSKVIIESFKTLQADLGTIQKRLEDKYGVENEKYIIIKKHIETIDTAIKNIEDELKGLTDIKRTTLDVSNKKIVTNYKLTFYQIKNDSTELSRFQNLNTLIAFIAKLLRIKPTSAVELDAATTKFKENVTGFSPR